MTTKEIAEWLDSVIEQLHQVRALALSMDTEPKSPKEALEKVGRGLCTYCSKPMGSEKGHRGAHAHCYKRINRRINDGTITNAQAVSRGYYLPATDKGGRRPPADDPIAARSSPPVPPRQTAKKKGGGQGRRDSKK